MLCIQEKVEKSEGNQSTVGCASLLNKMIELTSCVGKLVKSATNWE